MSYFKGEYRSVIYVADYEACRQFYEEGLGLNYNYSWDDGPDDRGVKYIAGQAMIEVIRRDPPLEQGPCTIMLEVDDVDACYKEMKQKPFLKFLEEIANRPYGIRCFRLMDPNKNDVVIFAYL